MRTVKIYFNPYMDSTKLIVDGMEQPREGGRVNEFIVGQSIRNWLAPYVCSYHRWDGLLAELMDYLNDDELLLYFYSFSAYFGEVEKELRSQAEYIEGRGYSSKLWKCECVEYYLPGKIKQEILKFIYAKKYFAPDQFSMEILEYCEKELQQQEEVTAEQLRDIYQELKKAVTMAIKFCSEKNQNPNIIKVWNKAERELQQIFGGKQ